MLIELKTKNKDGTIKFSGLLTEDELTFILNVGVNTMMNAGHLPFKKLETNTSIIIPETPLVQ